MAVVMPVWLGALKYSFAPFPWLDLTTLMGHLVYGMVLGVVFPFVEFG